MAQKIPGHPSTLGKTLGMFDVAVIGGGAVGLAIAKRVTAAGHTCVVLERSPHFISGCVFGVDGTLFVWAACLTASSATAT